MSRTIVRGKQYASLLQTAAGSISFYVRLAGNPTLKLMLSGDGLSSENIKAGVRIESDFPDLKQQEMKIKLNEPTARSISAYSNRVVKITFYARKRRGPNLDGRLYWIHPTIEQTKEKTNNNVIRQPEVSAFRAKHRDDNVLIFVLDAAGASHFGCYGYPKNTTPIIDSLAKKSLIWENAITTAVYTFASTGSLFTGLYPDLHGVVLRSQALHPAFKTMAESFKEEGYQTASFLGNGFAGPAFGYSQGFQTTFMLHENLISASDITPRVISWLNSVRHNKFFGYIHFREPHSPFSPPAEFLASFHTDTNFQLPVQDPNIQRTEEEKSRMRRAYDANLAFVDHELGKILSTLHALHLTEKTIIVVTADHGEGFWEHGLQGHNISLYEEVSHIPLLTWFPKEDRLQGVRRSQVVGNIDLYPTFLDLFGMSRKGVMISGHSLLPFVFTARHNSETIILSRAAFPYYSYRHEDLKFIARFTSKSNDELYNLASDPSEKINLCPNYPVLCGCLRVELRKELNRMTAAVVQKRMAVENSKIDEATEEGLRALGYVN